MTDRYSFDVPEIRQIWSTDPELLRLAEEKSAREKWWQEFWYVLGMCCAISMGAIGFALMMGGMR